MSDVRTRRLSLSVFVKSLAILAVSAALVTGAMFALSTGKARETGLNGLVVMAEDITLLTAESLESAVRFGNVGNIEATLDALLERQPDRVRAALVIGPGGEILASRGSEAGGALQDLAESVLSEGTKVTSERGLRIALPIGEVAEGGVRGALVVDWTDAVLMSELANQRGQILTITGIIFIIALAASGSAFWAMVSRPLTRIAQRTLSLAEADYDAQVPYKSRGDEIGATARNLDTLRERLAEARERTRDAVFQGAGFAGSSAAMMMTDTAFTITHLNPALHGFLAERRDRLASIAAALVSNDPRGGKFDAAALFGCTEDTFSSSEMPLLKEVEAGDMACAVSANKVHDASGTLVGYVFEWKDISEDRANKAVISSLEAAQMRLDFDAKGRLLSASPKALEAFEALQGGGAAATLTGLTGLAADSPETRELSAGHSVFDTFTVSTGGQRRLLSGSISPILGQNGTVAGYVLLGHDVTEVEDARVRAEAVATQRAEEQQHVVQSLSTALNGVAGGNLSIRLDQAFADAYEGLRKHFNDTMEALDGAVSLVLENSEAILGEADNISAAADDLSRRTEQQAATLEEFAAALTQLTASVSSASDGAGQARDVVISARTNAEASGEVVRQAVEAMDEISASSAQISRIISVIDDIAFQTNLLALNAGVEAARAGDAGRGFAVVASEVRALAQRSSDAAREINTLISTSGGHVERGVALVDKAGKALTDIVGTVGTIAEHVNAIAASAKEQSNGLAEINVAIGQLDQVTQQNVGMFEETTAATHTLTTEAKSLVAATSRFRTSARRTKAREAQPVAALPRLRPREGAAPASTSKAAATDGALAIAPRSLAAEDDWEDF